MSMEKKKEILTTLKEVQKWVSKMMESKSKFIYRGQGDDKWKLESTFVREYKEGLNYVGSNELFLFLKEYFNDKILFLKKELSNETEELSLFGKMQHYGNDTPLIDFTEDILVSLWFAASHSPRNILDNDPEYIKIFYFETNDKEIKTELKIDEIKFEDIKILKFKTNQKFGRSISQKSLFIFDTLNLNAKISSILISYDLQIEIIKWLDKLGLNAFSLFPDDEGIFQNFDSLSSKKFNLDGYKLIAAKKFQKAIKKLEKAIEINSDDDLAYINWGVALSKKNQLDEAIEKFKKAIEINPNNDLAYTNWGIVLSDKNKLDEAIEKFKKAIEINPDNDLAYTNWGIALFDKNKLDEAIEKFKKAIEINPNNDLAYTNWGTILSKKNQFNEAEFIEKFKKAIEINPDNDSAYTNWGTALSGKNKLDEAIEKFKKAIEINSNNIIASRILFVLKMKI